MAGDLDLAPFAAQYAFAVDQEGAAFDTFVLLAIQLLLADHIEQAAQGFISIADQLEGEALFGAEVLMGAQTVPGDAEHQGIGGLELLVHVAEVLRSEEHTSELQSR